MFYIISSLSDFELARDRLIAACEKREVKYEVLDPLRFDPQERQFSEKDSFYRISLTNRAKRLDIFLTKMRCRSLRIADFVRLDAIERDLLCSEAGINCIPTVYFPVLEPVKLFGQVEALGGFPVIVKEMGSSSGGGIMKVDSMSSLLSILRTVIKHASGSVFLKKYIAHDEQARIIVLNGEVIGEKGNLKTGDEIVLNTGVNFKQSKRKYSEEIHQMAVRAIKVLGLSFGGVDILLGSDGQNYLAEVNMPCAFTYVEDVAGVDIAGKIVEFLN
jgi:biotin carboxylase